MNTYEICATVEEHGRVLVAGVPFAPGTEVEVTISPKVQSREEAALAGEAAMYSKPGLQWNGNVIVHQGAGIGTSVAALREERLDRLGE